MIPIGISQPKKVDLSFLDVNQQSIMHLWLPLVSNHNLYQLSIPFYWSIRNHLDEGRNIPLLRGVVSWG